MTTEQTPLQKWANKMVAAHKANLIAQFAHRKPIVIWEPRSQSDPGVKYKVKQWPNGKLECNCPGFVYRKQCRHTKDEVLV